MTKAMNGWLDNDESGAYVIVIVLPTTEKSVVSICGCLARKRRKSDVGATGIVKVVFTPSIVPVTVYQVPVPPPPPPPPLVTRSRPVIGSMVAFSTRVALTDDTPPATG